MARFCNTYIGFTLLVLGVLLFPRPLHAVPWHQIKNYTKQEYQAASQNWSIARDTKGNLYFANNIGLLEFDGVEWTLNPAPNGSVTRAVAIDKDNRVFTAGYRELGYWERNPFGKLEYHSLNQQIEKGFSTNEEFWGVIVSGGKVYFQSFSMIYVYDYQTFNAISPSGFINSISDGGNGRIFVNIMGQGVFQLSGDTLSPLLTGAPFANDEIRFVLPIGNNKQLIGTANSGLLFFDGKALTPWAKDQEQYFKKNIINRGCIAPDGKIIIGTILDGISIFSPNEDLLQRFNKGNGLQNNTVLGIMADDNHNIWAALDKGIDLIPSFNDPSVLLVEREELGAVYTAAIYNHKLYLGTNQGLYVRPENTSVEPFALVPGTQGQVWECRVIDNRLFVSHNKGTLIINGDQTEHSSSISGGFSVIEDPNNNNTLIQSTYSNPVVFRKENSRWKIDRVIDQFNDLIRYLEADHLGNFWASHMYRSVFKLRFGLDGSVTDKQYYGEKVFGKDHNNYAFKIDNRIVFATGNQLFTFDDLRDTIVPYAVLNEKLGYFKEATRIVAAPQNRYWLIANQAIGLFGIHNSEVKKIKVFPTGLFNNQLIPGFENIIPINSDRAILCLENGYALLNADTIGYTSLISDKKPELRRISVSGKNDQITDLLPTSNEFKVRYNQNNLHFRFSFPLFGNNNIKYQSFVEGLDHQWSDPMDKPIFSLKRLPTGSYILKVKAIDPWGKTSQEYSATIVALPPWYLSTPAYIAYFLIVIASLLLFRQKIIAMTRQKESRDREEKERELIQLRNEKLQAELMFKSSELANSTMSIIKKNEFLMEVKEILKNQKEQLGTRYPDKYYNTLVEKIDDNMSSHDEWKVFEANFERAHEQFTKTLTDNYPDLTPRDLRLCAFLRMNLSSKEIAPLLGISVRGVENHRYRLRKRLNLDADSNLADFIIRL